MTTDIPHNTISIKYHYLKTIYMEKYNMKKVNYYSVFFLTISSIFAQDF